MSKKRLIFWQSNPLIYIIILFSFLTAFLLYTLFFLSKPSHANTSLTNNGVDSCGLIRVNLNQSPTCSVLSSFNGNSGSCKNPTNGATNQGIANQTLTVTLSSNNGASHQVTYATANNFCTAGYLNTSGNFCNCVSNPIYSNPTITVPSSGSVPVTITRSPTAGNACGSYQLDFSIQSVDGNTNCNLGNGSSVVGASLTCETGITCTAAPPPTPIPPSNCTTTPVNCSACAAPANTCNNGNGTQTCTLSQPQTCNQVVTTRSCTLNNCANGNVCTNQTCQPPTYTISGTIFNDLNKNGKIDSGESNYAATPNLSISRGTIAANANGTYTINNVTAGSVKLSYNSLPAGYYMTSPLNGPPPSFTVTVGNPGCTVNGAPGATCNTGNITNLNFGITNNHPWFQATCGDVRNDNGITDLLPAGQLADVTNASCTTPALSFTGDTDANYGSGQQSSTNQEAGGAAYSEVYSGASSLSTSYLSLLSKAQSAGITLIALATKCNLTSCTLPNNLPHGIYIANSNVTLNGYNFQNNNNYIFLINGNLTINGNLSIPNNPKASTALFSTTRNIIVASTVGSAVTNTASNLNGWFIAGQNFIVNSQGNCNDLRLNIAGSVVANAMGGGGTFQNNRDLCGSDLNDPTVTFTQRLDMVLNAPQFLAQLLTVSQEIAP